jgi:hypothetical protein
MQFAPLQLGVPRRRHHGGAVQVNIYVDPQLETAWWFQTLTNEYQSWFQKCAFQIQPAPLHHGAGALRIRVGVLHVLGGGLYKLNPADPYGSLKAPGFNP